MFIGISILVLAIATFVISFSMYKMQNQLTLVHEQQVRQSNENFKSVSRITFCYNNQIEPCSDDAIAMWNSANPNNQYGL